MLHRASSPSAVPPMVPRAHSTRGLHRIPPALPEKTSARLTSSSSSIPPVLPPQTAPKPPKGPKEGSGCPKPDHLYENTINIPGTKQHVVKNINVEARLTSLMRDKDDNGRPVPKTTDSAAYENINVEHISRLMALGFAQDAVIRALGITRNDLEMACDILHEFAQKSS
ncbi:PREDICTED: uncharacterized protein LOC105359139 [Ceratosolen solmsi marchali]|uniref:Uncharacterized protein LOC105359139 n=1 Tax=Ceratosolen solmsi marchali TaxID=326594 RepID=A0AAJ6VL41_9HYME|nr:PREDICTED: uncharacterized protein LOC105359139 [Ceratosolen solmsi marchali]